jgi:hypothetical protein
MTVADARPADARRGLSASQLPAVVEPLLEARGDGDKLNAALCKAVHGIGFEYFVRSRAAARGTRGWRQAECGVVQGGARDWL